MGVDKEGVELQDPVTRLQLAHLTHSYTFMLCISYFETKSLAAFSWTESKCKDCCTHGTHTQSPEIPVKSISRLIKSIHLHVLMKYVL
jgi:hypothetical protein